MSTAADIIKLALKDIQVLDEAETPSAALMSDALTTLNQMLALWQIDSKYIYGQVDTTKAATGAQTYTIGTGGDFNVSQPARVDYAFTRVNNIDYPCRVLSSWEEYQSISYKAVSGTFPEVLYLNQGVTLGTIYVFPKPTSGTLHVITSVVLPSYTVSADALSFPPEYDLVIRFSLAEILAAMIGIAIRPDIAKLAKNFRNMIRVSNTKIGTLGGGGETSSSYLNILGDI